MSSDVWLSTWVSKAGVPLGAEYKPIDVISVRVVDSKEEAAAMEVMLVSLHMADVGIQACRGGRWNMAGDMKRRPPYFEDCAFDSPRSDEALPPTPEEEVKLPDLLPPNYEVLRDENGITEEKAPKSCPCFRDERDPDGRLRHLAGLILH